MYSLFIARKRLIIATNIKCADSLEIFLKELDASRKEEIPIGAETTLCLNVIDGLGKVGWKGIAIRKFSHVSIQTQPSLGEDVYFSGCGYIGLCVIRVPICGIALSS